jgi:hypothetical protein
VAAAYSWAQAVQAGLVAHCRTLTVADALASSEAFPLVTWAAGAATRGRIGKYTQGAAPEVAAAHATAVPMEPPAGEATGWYLAMVAALGEPVTVHDVTGPLGVPTFACQLAGRTVAYGCATSAADALADGLGQLLLAYQARADAQPAYAPAPVPDLPAHLRGSATRPVEPGPPLGVPDLVAAMARRGCRAAAVPLDHDPEVHRAMPYVAHVVVTGSAS